MFVGLAQSFAQRFATHSFTRLLTHILASLPIVHGAPFFLVPPIAQLLSIDLWVYIRKPFTKLLNLQKSKPVCRFNNNSFTLLYSHSSHSSFLSTLFFSFFWFPGNTFRRFSIHQSTNSIGRTLLFVVSGHCYR